MDKKEPDFMGLGEAKATFQAPPGGEVGPEGVMAQMEQNRAAERKMLETLFSDYLLEQRRARRGRNLFRFFVAAGLIFLLWTKVDGSWSGGELESLTGSAGHTAVVDIQGPIMPGTVYSADHIIRGLTEAFEDPNTRGVILRINSPGGSPVQAGQVYDAVVYLRERFSHIPVYAALEDICASGGYYIAASAPTIYADKASMVGSIGVVLQGFGLEKAIEKLGVEQRQLTAGRHKAFLNPFAPVNPQEEAHAQELLRRVHAQFIRAVKQGRGDRLQTQTPDIFEGLIWTGDQAVKLGLVDGLGSAAWIARTQIKAKQMVTYTYKGDWLSRMGWEIDAMIRGAMQTPDVGWVMR